MALNSAKATLHRTSTEARSESETGGKASELKSLTDKRVYAEAHEHDVDHKVISGKWVLRRLGDVTSQAQYVLRGFEEDVRDEDVKVFAMIERKQQKSLWRRPAGDCEERTASAPCREVGLQVNKGRTRAGDGTAHVGTSDTVTQPNDWLLSAWLYAGAAALQKTHTEKKLTNFSTSMDLSLRMVQFCVGGSRCRPLENRSGFGL